MADTRIILAYRRGDGIVATAHGERYKAAHQALAASGFRRGDDWVHHLPSTGQDISRITVADLIRHARTRGVEVTTSSRRFLGDTAQDIAGLLPGRWDTRVELYSHPVWQGDLVPWLWDGGELAHAVQHEPIPYAATLTDAVSGATLLLVEHPGRRLGYLVGALAPESFEGGHGDQRAPHSIVLPPFADRAALVITERYLPAYERAVHARRLAAVTEALDRIRAEHDIWTTTTSGRYSEATSPDTTALGKAAETFLNRVRAEFLGVMQHAPALLDRCRPPATGRPEDARILARLADTLIDAESVDEDTSLTRLERNARLWPAIDTWLTHSEPFLRQARAAAPRRRHPRLAAAPPLRALPQGRHAPRR
ncbi:hypothetical protein IQ279_27055 [Streptomyces verrucosisporus]|uniref:hypothetical protein n=1 Tax=Streptomyces verrucosisporus TaxID=1695161 RepID=UPI0019D16F2B|nr:hypothetical protein [Streptomyces verrucosisporus]MBN3933218.1 hypothetical protein [Streptomyces verrucosisporus]